MRTKDSSAENTALDSSLEWPDKVKMHSPEYLSQILAVVTHDNNKSNFNYFGTDGKTYMQSLSDVSLESKYKLRVKNGLVKCIAVDYAVMYGIGKWNTTYCRWWRTVTAETQNDHLFFKAAVTIRRGFRHDGTPDTALHALGHRRR